MLKAKPRGSARLKPTYVTADDLACFMCHMAEAYARSLMYSDVVLVLEKCANAVNEEVDRASNPRVREMLQLTSEKMMAGEPFR